MKKILLLLLFVSYLKSSQAQKIQLPTLKGNQPVHSSETDVKLTVDKKGQLFIKEKKIELEDLRANLLKEFTEKADYTDASTIYSMLYQIELGLLVDRKLPYEKLEPILWELRRIDVVAVYFIYNYKLNGKSSEVACRYHLPIFSRDAKTNSMHYELRTAIKTNAEEIFKKRGKGEEDKILPPPPPSFSSALPYGYELVAEIKRDIKKFEIKYLEITNNSLAINERKCDAEELNAKMNEWRGIERIVYIVQPKSDCSYERFLVPFVELAKTRKILLNEASMEEYEKEYNALDATERRVISADNRHFILIDEE